MPVVAAIGGALIQAGAAKKAASAQTRAANKDMAFQKETRDIIRGDLSTYREGGVTAQNALDYELGLRARPMIGAAADGTGGTPYGGYTKTPGYDYRMNAGRDNIEAGAAARGGLNSGATLRDLERYRQDYSTNEYGNYLARLGARADTGINAASMSGQASQQAAAGVSNAYGNIGDARAGGAVATGRAINTGIENALGAWNYQRNLPLMGAG